MRRCGLQASQLIEVRVEGLAVIPMPRPEHDAPKTKLAHGCRGHTKIGGGFLLSQKARFHVRYGSSIKGKCWVSRLLRRAEGLRTLKEIEAEEALRGHP